MTAGLLAADPVPEGYLDLITKVGVFGAITIFFLFRDQKREAKMNAQLEKSEDFTRTKLLLVIEESHQLQRAATEALRENTRALEHINVRLSKEG